MIYLSRKSTPLSALDADSYPASCAVCSPVPQVHRLSCTCRYEGTHDIHSLILGRAITGIAAF